MIAVTCLAAALLLVLLRAPETRIGRWLHRALVAPTAARLDRIGRGHLLAGTALAVLVAAVLAVVGHEGVQLAAMAAPDLAAWAAAADVATLFDLAAAALAAALTLRPGRDRTAIRPGRPRPRRRRSPLRPRQPAANDDEPGLRPPVAA